MAIAILAPDGVRIPLTKGFEAIIDAADVTLVSEYRWHAMINKSSGHVYARCTVHGIRQIFMHRILMQAQKGEQIDHIDGNGLNNRRANLRRATSSQNQANRGAAAHNKIGIKGVSLIRSGKYRAQINNGNNTIYLGLFDTAAEASAAYVGAARVLWGEFAKGG